jgi:hypothetical protein
LYAKETSRDGEIPENSLSSYTLYVFIISNTILFGLFVYFLIYLSLNRPLHFQFTEGIPYAIISPFLRRALTGPVFILAGPLPEGRNRNPPRALYIFTRGIYLCKLRKEDVAILPRKPTRVLPPQTL